MKNTYKFAPLLIVVFLLQGCAPALIAGGTATGIAMVHDRRSAGTVLDDKGTQMKVRRKIAKDEELSKNSHITPVAYNNVVVLVGQTPTAKLKQRAEMLANQVPNVNRVYNELSIAGSNSMLTRSSDALITTKIKSGLLMDKKIDASRVKVVTEDGIVYLLGIVNPQEDQIAVDIARKVKGVKKVVKIFEYVS